MRIINPELARALEQRAPVRLELGSGGKRRPGFYGVDLLELDGVDAVADLNEPLSALPDDCCEHVYSHHALEHVREFMPLMAELHRITRADGMIEVIVPHFSNPYGFSDPTHVRFFGLYTMNYFVEPELQPKVRRVPCFYTPTRFRMESVKIGFYREGLLDKILYPLIKGFTNAGPWTQDFYERRLSSLFHARQITYRMRPVKAGVSA